MDFNDTIEEAAFRGDARAWLARVLPERAVSAAIARFEDEAGVADAKAYQAKKAAAGYAALTLKKEDGGADLAPIFQVIFNQEEARFNAPSGPLNIGTNLCVPTILAYGTDAQKARFVQPVLRGEEVWCQLFSEPSAGSDIAGLTTRAVRDGDDWVVSGQKVWTSGAHYSDFGILLARTDPEKEKHKGLTMFVLDIKAPGIEVRPIHQITDSHDFNEVYLSEVRIPDDRRLGPVGEGWGVTLVTLANERYSAGEAFGPDYQEVIELARTLPSPAGDGRLIDDSAFREQLASWYVVAEGHRLGKFRTLTALSRGETPGPENSIGKLINAGRMQELNNYAIEAQDLHGLITDPDIAARGGAFQSCFLWAAALRVAGGTDEVLRNVIAERVLGLPQDMRVDKGVPFKDLPVGR